MVSCKHWTCVCCSHQLSATVFRSVCGCCLPCESCTLLCTLTTLIHCDSLCQQSSVHTQPTIASRMMSTPNKAIVLAFNSLKGIVTGKHASLSSMRPSAHTFRQPAGPLSSSRAGDTTKRSCVDTTRASARVWADMHASGVLPQPGSAAWRLARTRKVDRAAKYAFKYEIRLYTWPCARVQPE